MKSCNGSTILSCAIVLMFAIPLYWLAYPRDKNENITTDREYYDDYQLCMSEVKELRKTVLPKYNCGATGIIWGIGGCIFTIIGGFYLGHFKKKNR